MAIKQFSGTIAVDMNVTRYQVFPDDGIVQIWGYVGDYEVSVWLPITDVRVKGIIQKRQDKKPKADGKAVQS